MKNLTILIKNMICPSCIYVVSKTLDDLGIQYGQIGVGYAVIDAFPEPDLTLIDEKLREVQLGLIEDQNEWVVSKIRQAIFDYLDKIAFIKDKQNLSEFLANELGMNYSYLSKLFSKYREYTIEQYYIQIRTEKVKDLLREGKLNHSQIACVLGYSSLQYLSGQFKNTTGMTMSEYKSQWLVFLEKMKNTSSPTSEMMEFKCNCGSD